MQQGSQPSTIEELVARVAEIENHLASQGEEIRTRKLVVVASDGAVVGDFQAMTIDDDTHETAQLCLYNSRGDIVVHISTCYEKGHVAADELANSAGRF